MLTEPSRIDLVGWRRTLGSFAGLFVVVTSLAYGILSFAWPHTPVVVHVRWKPDVTDARRVELERQFTLTHSEPTEGTTWRYGLADSSTGNIRALIQNEAVDDTAHLNRIRYRPEFAQDRSRQIPVYSVAIGGIGSVALLLLIAVRRRQIST